MSYMDSDGRMRFLTRADALLEQRMYDLVMDLADERLQRLPDDVDARIVVCKTWTRMGKLEKVTGMLQEVEQRITDWARLYAAMGDICLDSGLKKEAIRFYRRFLTLNPQGSYHGAVLEKLQRLMDIDEEPSSEEEADHYGEITDIASDFHTMTLAELYLRQNHLDMARHVLEEILRREPGHPEAAAMIHEIDAGLAAQEEAQGRMAQDRIILELSRWLQNLDRIRRHAA